ncbi:MAG: hypothetical protein NZM13_05010 [Cyclobacteriaceae bacterium]|nr:hypothetical protein [Cyclobacteriaceae bacterium]MDW8331069.1 hypothetical protein [Cyclobacteriaceae bacterium]
MRPSINDQLGYETAKQLKELGFTVIVQAAILPDDGSTGKFFRDG